MNIGALLMSLVVDDTKFAADITKKAGAAGDKAGVTLGQRMGSGLTKGMTALGATAGVIFTGAVGGAAEFEDQLRTINTVAKLTDEELDGVGKSILDLSKETGKSTDDLTAGFYDLVSAGVSADDAVGVLRDSAVLATGALGTTGETVDLLTSAINAYGLEAKDSARVSDIFAQAVADGKVTASELGGSLANIAPIAASAGVSLEEVAAGYAVLTAKGVPAAQAATQMRAAISALLTPNETLNELTEQTGINFAELARQKGLVRALEELRKATGGNDEAFAKALGSVEAYQFAVQTTGSETEAFATELDKVTTAAEEGGVAQGQYEERMKSAKNQATKFVAGLRATALELGGPFVDSLGAGVLALNELGGGMGGLVNLSRLFGGAIGGAAGFLTSKLGPRLKRGFLGALAKVVIPAAAFAAPLESGLEGGLEQVGKSSRIKGATKKLGDFLGTGLGKGLSVAFAAIAIFEVIETYKRIAAGLDEQSKAIGTGVAKQIVAGTTEELQRSRAAVMRGLQDLNEVYDAGLFTNKQREALEKQLATLDAELKRRAAGIPATVADSMADGQAQVTAGAAQMALGIPAGIAKAKTEAARVAGQTPQAIADAISEKRNVVSSALAALRDAMANEMSPAKERMRLIAELTGEELAKGLRSKDPVVRAAAQNAKDVMLERLKELAPANGKLGKRSAELLAKGLKSKDPDVRAAARKIKETIETKLRETKARAAGVKAGQNVRAGLVSQSGPVGTAAYNMGRRIARNVLGGILYQGGGRAEKDDKYTGKAGGGPVKAGFTYQVNEKGQELFTPNVDGRIITASDARQLMDWQAPGGGDSYTINVPVQGALPVRTIADITTEMRRIGEVGLLPSRLGSPKYRMRGAMG